jgi:O-antigen/teichoic acid export membrane protein
MECLSFSSHIYFGPTHLLTFAFHGLERFPSNNMSGKKLSKNIIIYGLSNGLKSLVPFVMLPILTFYISAEGVGLLSLIETSILFVSPFILLNLEAGVGVEFFKTDRKNLAQFISNGILLSLVAFGIVSVIFLGANQWLENHLEIPKQMILLLPIFVLLRLVPSLVLVLFQAQQKAFSYLIFSLFQTVIDFSLSAIFIIILKHGYLGRLEGTYIAFFMATIIGLVVIYRMGYFHFSISKKQIQNILKFGIPLIPHAIGGTIIAMSDRYFISYFEGNAEVGYYTIAYQVGALLLLFSRSVNQAWSPMLYDLLGKKNYSQIDRFTSILFVTFIGFGLIVYLTSPLIFGHLVDQSFISAQTYFPLLLLGFLFQSLYFLFTNFLFYSKRTDILAVLTFSGALLNLVLNYILIKKMGVIGVAYSTAITWFLFFTATFIIAKFKIYRLEKLT